MNNCRIGKVKYKNGTELTVLPPSYYNFRTIKLSWGEITFRLFDNNEITNGDVAYMADAVKHIVMFGENNK